MVYITNTQRNDFVGCILAHDFTACQLKFIIYLYNNTINLQKVSLTIHNMAKLARILGYNDRYFRKQISILSDNDVIIRTNKQFSVNLDTKIWQTDSKRVAKCRMLLSKDIKRQLDN